MMVVLATDTANNLSNLFKQNANSSDSKIITNPWPGFVFTGNLRPAYPLVFICFYVLLSREFHFDRYTISV